jgi:hypothetical protein
MGSYWSTPLGIAAIIFIIVGVIMALAGIVLLVVDKDVEKPWYIWTLLVGGAVLAIIGGIMLAIAYSRQEPKLVQSSYIQYDACGNPIPQNPMNPVLNIQESSPALMMQPQQYVYQQEIGTPHYHTMSTPENPIPFRNVQEEEQIIRQTPVSVQKQNVQTQYVQMPPQTQYVQMPPQTQYVQTPMKQPAYMVGVTKKDDSHVHFDPKVVNISSPGVEIPFVTRDGTTGRYVTDSENRQYVVPGSVVKADLYQGGVEVQTPVNPSILKSPKQQQQTQQVFVPHANSQSQGGMWIADSKPSIY